MKIFPAIDLLGGKVVRLTYGDYNVKKTYDIDPLEAARSFVAAGAEYIHVVDLDGAKTGSPVNRDAIRAIASTPLYMELGGGLREESQVEEILSLGVDRAILGTAAAENPDFARRMAACFGDKIAVGVDARDGKVAVRGWQETTGKDALQFVKEMKDIGIGTVIFTDIARDGALKGPNLEWYARLAKIQGMQITASGGVTCEEDVKALADLGLYAAIVGKALYEGRLSLERAIALGKGAAL